MGTICLENEMQQKECGMSCLGIFYAAVVCTVLQESNTKHKRLDGACSGKRIGSA